MRLESREFVLIAFCLGILLLFGLIGLNAQTVDDPTLQAGLTALEAGDLDTAEARFQEILTAPASHTEEVVDLAQLGMLRVHRERDDLTAFETELQALEARSPASPVIDDAVFLYAQFTFDRGEYHFSASIAELFLEDPVLTSSEYGEEAAILAMEAYWKGYDSEEFERMRQVFLLAFPESGSIDEVDLLNAQVAIDVDEHFARGVLLCDQFLLDYPQSDLVPQVRFLRAEARTPIPPQWGLMFDELEAIARDCATSDPELACEAVLALALRRWVIEQDEETPATLLSSAATEFAGTEAGETAARWSRGLGNWESVEHMEMLWETLNTAMEIWPTSIQGIFACRRMVVSSRSEAFESYMADPTVSDEDKAEWLQRLCFADYNTDHLTAAWNRAQRILDEYPDTEAAQIAAPAYHAMLLHRAGRWRDSLQILEGIRAQLPPGAEDAGYVHRHVAETLLGLHDEAGAVAVLVEQLERFPDDRETARARLHLEQLTEQNPALAAVRDLNLERVGALLDADLASRPQLEDLRAGLIAAAQGVESNTENPQVAEAGASEGPPLDAVPTAHAIPGGAEVVR